MGWGRILSKQSSGQTKGSTMAPKTTLSGLKSQTQPQVAKIPTLKGQFGRK